MIESIETAVRMVGHLLEHHGTTGPFAADKDGIEVAIDDPAATSWCLAGACELVSSKLGFCKRPWLDHTIRPEVLKLFSEAYSTVPLWEGNTPTCSTTPERRLEIARKLQRCGL